MSLEAPWEVSGFKSDHCTDVLTQIMSPIVGGVRFWDNGIRSCSSC